LVNILCRPQVTLVSLLKVLSCLNEKLAGYDTETIEQAEIVMKYQGYIVKEQEMINKINRLENISIEQSYDYSSISSLSSEARQKLNKIKPRTLGQAARISGVSPADISILLVHMGR
jgi:tRNA uridine 5-carboxymethylaminomethyl modification enzyme